MKILKLHASFGKLEGELQLQEGMNVLCLPNEAGKSTWSAFILAMLYGIDTKERSSAANAGLPAKERYKPWSGKPMEGSMELLWQGRRITLERRSTAKAPMSVFRAYDTDSGQPIEELNGENCGKILCGVERSVFERTAFIRQLGLPVTEDNALEQRLGALVSTGEEGAKSATRLEKELGVLKNQISGRVGRIAKLQAELSDAERKLTEITRLQDDSASLRAEKEALEAEKTRLDALLLRIERAKQAQKRVALQELNEKQLAQETLCKRLEETVAALPSEHTLHEIQKRLDKAESDLQTAQMETAFAPAPTAKPAVPPCFADRSVEQAEEQVETDTAEYRRLCGKKSSKKWLFLWILPALAGAAAAIFWKPLIGLCVVGAAALGFGITLLLLHKKNKQLVQAEKILKRYGVTSVSELPALYERFAAEQHAYAALAAEEEAQKQALLQQLHEAQTQVDAVISEVSVFAPECKRISDCRQALSAALLAHSSLAAERRALENLRAQLRSVHALLSDAPAQLDTQALQMDEAKLSYEQKAAAQKLSVLTSKLAEQQGRIAATGDVVALEAKCDTLRSELAAAQETAQILDIALSALQVADCRLRSRFSPRITAEAGRILAELTEGKYPSVLLEPDMRLSVRDEAVLRPAAAMSCGTADQMYLALRLAMCAMLLPKDVPLILDDALVNFDEARCKAALRLLQKETRQVILFTCREL